MISRIEIVKLYQLILDREPESEQVVGEKRSAFSLSEAASEMLMSEEFLVNNNALIAACLGMKGD